MSKPPGFAADLSRVESAVANDVSRILKVVQEESRLRQQPPVTESPAEVKPKSTPRRPTPVAVEPPTLLAMTTRISSHTNDRLTAAALRQRLKKAKPDSRQAIVEEALREWFKRHGYDRDRDPPEHSSPDVAEEP